MKTHTLLTSPRTLVVLLAALVLTSCASEMRYGANRGRLERAEALLAEGGNAPAAEQMEKLLTETTAEASTYALQRFYAAYLLTRAHLDAAFGEPFLRGAATGSTGFRLSDGGSRSGSSLANLVASTYYAAFGRDWYRTASSAPPVVKGEKLVTESLEALGPRNALTHLNLVLVTAYAKLHFQDRIEFVLGEMGELQNLEQCDRILADAQVGPAMQAWVYRAVFDYLKKRDEVAAYRFAIRVLDCARQASDHDPALVVGVAHWITRESKYVFKCPSCGQEVDPALPGCTVCRRPNLEFEPEERMTEAGG